jgi:hypothetical protein
MRVVNETGKKANVESADYKSTPHEILEAVDRQIKTHGLGVVMIETGSDQYEWFIEPL